MQYRLRTRYSTCPLARRPSYLAAAQVESSNSTAHRRVRLEAPAAGRVVALSNSEVLAAFLQRVIQSHTCRSRHATASV
jgi:hypothetical protein